MFCASETPYVCPWWLAYTFDHRLRRIWHKPEKMFAPYLSQGMTALDIGCGMGYFSLEMARMVGEHGLVIAVDLQLEMLDRLKKRAKYAELAQRISCYHCDPVNIGNHTDIDFALTFWMAHEVPFPEQFFAQIYAALKPGGKLFWAEPKIHVSRSQYRRLFSSICQAGFVRIATPYVTLSRAAVFEKRE